MRHSALTSVPDRARAQVDNELALLDKQVAEAYQRLQRSAQAARQDGDFADNAITGPLRDKRVATIDRIAIAIATGRCSVCRTEPRSSTPVSPVAAPKATPDGF